MFERCVYSRLRLEASQCPEVVVAQIDPKKLSKKQTVIASVSESITRHERSARIQMLRWVMHAKIFIYLC